MTRRTTIAVLLAILASFAAGRATAAPRSAHDIPAGSVGFAEPDRGRIGAPPSPAAPADPTALPADHAATAVVVPADDAPAPEASMPAGLVGIASWYRYVAGQAAAGPRLRAALGPGWRGMVVVVSGLSVRLTDWCQCFEGRADERLLDLDSRTFSRLAQLTRGLVAVEVQLP